MQVMTSVIVDYTFKMCF